MSHELSVKRPGGYLHITVTGDNTPEDVQQYLLEVHESCVKHSCPYVLIEENLQGHSLETLEIFRVIAKAAQPSSAVRCIAYVDVNPEHDADRMKFAETVANNRAMMVKIFTDLSEAEKWLSQYAAAADGEL
jgi:hypothetical protein